MKVDNNRPAVQSSKDIQALIASFRRSGLGLEQFAREHRIPAGRLHYWLYQKYRTQGLKLLRNGPEAEAPVFQEVRLDPSALMASWAAEVRLDSKLSIRFSA